jgi:hypothetical protein
MALVQLTLKEIDLIATLVLDGEEQPFASAFEQATAMFYGDAECAYYDESAQSRVTVVDVPSDALLTMPGRLYGVAEDMDARARTAAKAHDHESAEWLHRTAGILRALAVHITRSC